MRTSRSPNPFERLNAQSTRGTTRQISPHENLTQVTYKGFDQGI
jgi:hypothetical protein